MRIQCCGKHSIRFKIGTFQLQLLSQQVLTSPVSSGKTFKTVFFSDRQQIEEQRVDELAVITRL